MTTRKRTDYLVVHCTATPPDRDIGADEVDAMHKALGWSGIGYHAIIRRSGFIELGRPFSVVGAHVKGYNAVSVGVALVGGVNRHNEAEDNFTLEQYDTLYLLLKVLLLVYPGATVLGHRDLSPDSDGDGEVEPHEWLKVCPCFNAGAWFKARQRQTVA